MDVSGPFGTFESRSMSVAFSSHVAFDSANIVIPLITKNDMWGFLNPFDYEIWVAYLISIPIFVVIMSGLEYIAIGKVNWDNVVGFALRNVLSETMKKLPNKKHYEKILVLVWIWSCSIIVWSFAGNLTAMITRPKLDMKFTRLEDFVDQNEVSLVIEEGIGTIDWMQKSPAKSPLRKLIDETERLKKGDANWTSGCFTNDTQYTKIHASVCDGNSILALLGDDFSKTGKCNWYTMKSNFYEGGMVMVFQVQQQR